MLLSCNSRRDGQGRLDASGEVGQHPAHVRHDQFQGRGLVEQAALDQPQGVQAGVVDKAEGSRSEHAQHGSPVGDHIMIAVSEDVPAHP